MDYQRLLEYQNKCRYRNQLIYQLNTDYPKLSSIYQYMNSKSYKRALGSVAIASAIGLKRL